MESVAANLGGEDPRLIDEDRLESDSGYRYDYVTDFMDFSEADMVAVSSLKSALAPQIPDIVDRVFDKLFSYDATMRHVLSAHSPQSSVEGDSLMDLEVDPDVLDYQKSELGKSLRTLITSSREEGLATFIDKVGNYCTQLVNKSGSTVPHVQMDALLGLLADVFKSAIFELKLDREREINSVRALGKFFWIQNNLLSRHYGY